MGREGCSLGSASTVLPHTLEAASQSRLAANPACTNSKGVLPGPIRHKGQFCMRNLCTLSGIPCQVQIECYC